MFKSANRSLSAPLLAAVALTVTGLTGCSTVGMSVTEITDTAMVSSSKGLGSSTDASITKPEGHSYARARVYAASQIAMIRREAATGGGENIRALATLMGESNARAFGEWMQDNYARLFGNLKDPEMLVARIRQLRNAPTP